MRNVNWLIAAGLIAATTTGCVESTGYPSTYYGASPSYSQSGYGYGYGAQPAYYGQQGYYQPTSRYSNSPRRWW